MVSSGQTHLYRFRPVGKIAGFLATYISSFVRDPVRFPLIHDKWEKMESAAINDTITDLRVYFDFPENEEVIKWIKKELKERWRTWKARVKREYFTPHLPNIDECRANIPPGVDPTDWFGLIRYWCRDDVMKVAETNKKNKAMTKHPYVGGRQSMAQIGHAYKKKYGTQPSRFCMFHKTRLKADETCVNQVTADLIELMEEDQERRRSESSSEFVDAPGPNDVFGSHMPPESRGRIRMMPFVAPTDAGFRNSSSGGVSGLRKGNDGLRKELAELREIQERQGRDMAALMALIQQQQRPPSTSESSQQL